MGKSIKFVWKTDPTAIVGRMQGLVRKKALDMSKAIYDDIVKLTPVDTGVARANWKASIGAPNYSHISVRISGTVLSPPAFPLREIPLYGKVYITNATPYIQELEYGWSRQAPHGMVRLTMAKFGVGIVHG